MGKCARTELPAKCENYLKGQRAEVGGRRTEDEGLLQVATFNHEGVPWPGGKQLKEARTGAARGAATGLLSEGVLKLHMWKVHL